MRRTRFSPPVIKVSFLVCLTILLSPLFCFKFFPTVDGPAHLYNAAAIRNLLFGNGIPFGSFFDFNKLPVPNWSGHLIAVLAGWLFPVWLVEKLIVILITLLLPASIYKLLSSYNYRFSWHYFLVLVFAYNFLLYIGFFNFLLALPLFFFSLAVVKNKHNNLSLNRWIFLMLLNTAIYFSHIMVFFLSVMFTFFQLAWINRNNIRRLFFSKNVLRILSSFLPGIILSIWFYKGRSLAGFRDTIERSSMHDLLKSLLDGGPLIGLNEPVESPYTTLFVAGLGLLMIISAVLRFRNKTGWLDGDFFLVSAFILLGLYFIVPNGIASGGFVSPRILLLVLLFSVLWLLLQPVPEKLQIGMAALTLFVTYSVLPYRFGVARQLDQDAGNWVNVAEYIRPNKVVLPLNYSDNWLHINISNYLGAGENVVVLDNYEAVLKEFPLVWIENRKPGKLAGNFTQSRNPTITPGIYENATGIRIDYVIRWKFPAYPNDSIMIRTDSLLHGTYANMTRVGDADIFYNPR